MKYQSDDFYKFHPFQLESYLAKHEQNVTFNYSESGVHPLRLGDLLELADIEIEALGDTVMDYPEVNGKIELRRKIAALYPKANEDNVLVTIGASEANHLVAATLLGDGDEVVTLQPSYLQLSGNALNRGIKVNFVKLVEKDNWALDISDLNNKVTSSTRLISIINPIIQLVISWLKKKLMRSSLQLTKSELGLFLMKFTQELNVMEEIQHPRFGTAMNVLLPLTV